MLQPANKSDRMCHLISSLSKHSRYDSHGQAVYDIVKDSQVITLRKTGVHGSSSGSEQISRLSPQRSQRRTFKDQMPLITQDGLRRDYFHKMWCDLMGLGFSCSLVGTAVGTGRQSKHCLANKAVCLEASRQ